MLSILEFKDDSPIRFTQKTALFHCETRRFFRIPPLVTNTRGGYAYLQPEGRYLSLSVPGKLQVHLAI